MARDFLPALLQDLFQRGKYLDRVHRPGRLMAEQTFEPSAKTLVWRVVGLGENDPALGGLDNTFEEQDLFVHGKMDQYAGAQSGVEPDSVTAQFAGVGNFSLEPTSVRLKIE